MEDLNTHTVYILGLLFAQQAQIEGMKAENWARDKEGRSLAYTEKDFFDIAEIMESLVETLF